MGLNVAVGSFTAETTNGNDSVVTLADEFDLKAIILWTAGATATGLSTTGATAGGRFCIGFGTYRSSTVQHGYNHIYNQDAATSSVVSGGANNNSILRINSADNVVEAEADLVSFDTASGSSPNRFTIDWIDAAATAFHVAYIALGGSDITDACVFSYSDALATDPQDVTVISGFGKPDLLLQAPAWRSNAGLGNSAGAVNTALFASGQNFLNGRGVSMRWFDNNTNIALQSRQGAFATIDAGTNINETAILDAVANWPTDGFRLDKTVTTDIASSVTGLALKGTFQYSIGTINAPTGGSPPVNTDYNAGFTPSLGLVWGSNLPTDATYNGTSAELGVFSVGATDGTNQRLAGITEDDGAGTSDTNSLYQTGSIIEGYTLPSTLDSDADGSFNGNNVRFTYNSLDTPGREYNVLAVGAAPAAATASLIWQPATPTIYKL